MNAVFTYLLNRVKEPSTWGSLAAFLTLMITQLPAAWTQVNASIAIVATVCAAIGTTLAERNHTPPSA